MGLRAGSFVCDGVRLKIPFHVFWRVLKPYTYNIFGLSKWRFHEHLLFVNKDLHGVFCVIRLDLSIFSVEGGVDRSGN